MRYELDTKNKLIDFYVEDEGGKEVGCAMKFGELMVMVNQIAKDVFGSSAEVVIYFTGEP